ncbi:SpoIIE family protein phosphatase [Streptomyces meridianus]|uniref:PAS domain-containing SpoIIE family protein phosphatase/ATP-binding protein n=1 Tax=Streptomyces meridianus TaxID=2938945 RepID=A0ABT0XCV0_9ACTN|nr:SpoIIE family protein phosphatase [Streptomyces meridianus]MCM2579542.1 PAS domain-containing SpoIIE family protein phosphatase/ATP-binding protein [Streptomyces meridianus]
MASFVVDGGARITSWGTDAAAWFGRSAEEVLGQHCGLLFGEDAHEVLADASVRAAAGEIHTTVLPATLGDGTRRDVLVTCSPLSEITGRPALLCQVADVEELSSNEVRTAFVDALMRKSPLGLGVLDNDLRYVLVNDTLADFNGVPAPDHLGRRVGELVRAADGGEYEKRLRRVLETGESLRNLLIACRTEGRPDRDRVWSVSFFRLTGNENQVLGLGGMIFDVTERETALLDASAVRQRLSLVNQAGTEVGTSLGMAETARELTDFAVPEFADAAIVELRREFLESGRHRPAGEPVPTLRIAARSVLDDPVARLLFTVSGRERMHPVGSPVHEVVCTGRAWRSRVLTSRTLAELAPDDGTVGLSPARGPGSLILAPLKARGRCLGFVAFARSTEREPLDADDVKVAEELATRTAISLDNARLYDEERRVAIALQRNMLPDAKDVAGRPGLDIAYHYWSTGSSARVGGDWFDVIPLSGHRVALVVGDMMGHDIHAAAGMGQLRTAMHTLAELDLDPVDLFVRLDGIVENNPAMDHATCVYAVYNTVTRRCSIANAGHPPPVLRYSDRTTEVARVDPGMPLGTGLGGPEFTVVDLELPEDSILVLYTDGLVERRSRDIDVGIEALRAALAAPVPSGLSVQQVCDDTVAALENGINDDDLAVLMARAPAVPDHRSARWTVPPVPGSAPRARELVGRAMRDWGLEALMDTAQLLMSELVTNAVRHARGDIEIQMAKGETLVVEVSDDDERLPHRAHVTELDEKGRGLAVVDGIARGWGARSVRSGKVVWFELPLAG